MVNTGVEYTPGQLLAVVTPATVVVVDAPTDWSLAGPLWELALDDAPIDEILDCLVRRGIRTAPTFAVVRVEETAVRVLVRGPVRVGVERSGDPVRLDASGATTWLEAVVSTPRRVLVGAVDPTARSPYLVSTGVVLAGGLVLPCIPQAAQRFEEERREIAPPPPPAVSPPPAQLMAGAAPAPPAQAPAPESAPAIVDLTRLESPASSGIMAGRSAWMDQSPGQKPATPEAPKPAPDLPSGPVRKAPAPDGGPTPFRTPEPAAFQPPASRPLPPGATPPVPPSPPVAPPAAAPSPGLAPVGAPSSAAPGGPSAFGSTGTRSAGSAEAKVSEGSTSAKSLLDDADDADAPPPGPSPADLPSLDPPSVPVSLPSLSRPAAVFAPPVDRPGDDDEEDDDGRDKVVASPSGLPVRVRGQSMPVDLRGALNGIYRDTGTPPRPAHEQPVRPTFDRPSIESSPYERSVFDGPKPVQDLSGDRSGLQRPTFDRPLVEDRAQDESDDDAADEAREAAPAEATSVRGDAAHADAMRGDSGRDSVIQLPRRPDAPGGSGPSGDERPMPPGSRPGLVKGPSAPSPIRPGVDAPGGSPAGPRPIPPAPDRPDLGGTVAPPLPAFFRGTRVARGEPGGPSTPAGPDDPADAADDPASGEVPRVPGVLRAVNNDDPDGEDGDDPRGPDALREPPRLLGVWCDAGHVTSPDHSECRVCGLSVPPQAPILVARPPLGELVFDNGERVSVDRPVILGRDPKPVQSPDAEPPLLHPVHSATGQVSRTHAEVRAVGWDVVVTDLDAMNGTTVTQPGGEPEPLEPRAVTVIDPGARVDLGGEVGFVFEVDA